MSVQTIRPSTKTVKIGYVLGVLLVVAAAVTYRQIRVDGPAWVPALALFALLIPIKMHIERLLTKMTLEGDRLRYEHGLLSKTTRVMELRKVQDVRVDQNLKQRLLAIGDLAIETAGESSRLVMKGIDDPQRIAELILNAARSDSARFDSSRGQSA